MLPIKLLSDSPSCACTLFCAPAQPGDHHFLFSITGTRDGWHDAWRAGVQPNNPLTYISTPLPTGIRRHGTSSSKLPLIHSFCNVSAASPSAPVPDVWITAVKKEDGEGTGGLALRLFGVSAIDQQNVTIQLNVGTTLTGASATDLIEMHPSPLPGVAGGNTVSLDVGHWSIETLVLGVDVPGPPPVLLGGY
jgi:alpha-mannosidase